MSHPNFSHQRQGPKPNFSTPRATGRHPSFPTKDPKPNPGLPRLRGPDRNPLSPHQGSQTETRASNTKGPGSKPSFPTMSRGKPQNIKTTGSGSQPWLFIPRVPGGNTGFSNQGPRITTLTYHTKRLWPAPNCFTSRVLGRSPSFPHQGSERNPGLPKLKVPDRNSAVPHQRPETDSRTFQTKDPKSKHCFSTPRVPNRIPGFPGSQPSFPTMSRGKSQTVKGFCHRGVRITVTAPWNLISKSHGTHHIGSVGC